MLRCSGFWAVAASRLLHCCDTLNFGLLRKKLLIFSLAPVNFRFSLHNLRRVTQKLNIASVIFSNCRIKPTKITEITCYLLSGLRNQRLCAHFFRHQHPKSHTHPDKSLAVAYSSRQVPRGRILIQTPPSTTHTHPDNCLPPTTLAYRSLPSFLTIPLLHKQHTRC